MTHEVVIYPATALYRQPPANRARSCDHLFNEILVGKSKEVVLKRLRGVSINNEVFLKRGIKILPESFGDTWQEAVYNQAGYLLKNFVKDALRKKISVDKALWTFDTFSTGGYFHWITEIAPRLWIASKHVDGNLPLLIPEYFLSKWKFGADVLRPFGRQLLAFRESQVLKCAEMYFISPPGGPFNYQPEPIKNSSSLIKSYYYKSNYRGAMSTKIYISRAKAGKRMVLNEEKVIEIVSGRGYRVYYLEDLTLEDQVNLFSRASHVLSIHGAGLSNMVFMEPGSTVTEIRHRDDNKMLSCFFTLSATCSHHYYFSFGDTNNSFLSLNERRPEDRSVTVDLRMLSQVLNLQE